MNRKRFQLFSFIVIVFFLIFLASKTSTFADTTLNRSVVKKIEVKVGGQSYRFRINSFTEKSEKLYLLSDSIINKEPAIELTGFEDGKDISICQIEMPDNANFFCLEEEVGVHAKNYQLIKISDDGLRIIPLINGNEAQVNLVSDLPLISINDYNADQSPDLIIYQRDYDNDPISDIISYYYQGNGRQFVFDKISAFTYDGEKK